MKLEYPYGVLDYESSGLDDHTYPIEIGIAIKRTPSSAIESWGSLIRPAADWVANGCWNEKSETIHNIPRSDLTGAPTVEHVARQAMKFAGDIPLYFDGGKYDLYWHNRLAKQVGRLDLNILPVYMIIEANAYLGAFQCLHIEHRAVADAIQNIEVIEQLIRTND